MRIFILIFITLLTSPITSHAQNNTNDSLKMVLESHGRDIHRVNTLNNLSKNDLDLYNYRSSPPYAKVSLALAKELNFKRGLKTAFSNLGVIYFHQLNDAEAIGESAEFIIELPVKY